VELLPGGETERIPKQIRENMSGAGTRERKLRRVTVRTKGIRL